MSQGRNYADVTLGRNQDVSSKFMRYWITSIVFVSWCFAETML